MSLAAACGAWRIKVLDLGRFEIFRQATFPPGLLTHRAVFGVQPAARGPTCGPGRRGRQRYTFHYSVAPPPSIFRPVLRPCTACM